MDTFHEDWPIEVYQNVYATEAGSAEMPSAGRAFTPEVITKLVAKGIQIAPLILHTGVASLEADEPPFDEYYRVPGESARMINLSRENAGRIIAVGTTVVGHSKPLRRSGAGPSGSRVDRPW